MSVREKTLLSISVAAVPGAEVKTVTHIHFLGQDSMSLCWAACTAMVLEHLNKLGNLDLCQIAALGLELPESVCCPDHKNNQVKPRCNRPVATNSIKTIWRSAPFLIQSHQEGDRITFEQIRDEIRGDRPVMIGYGSNTNQDVGHLALIVGFQKSLGGPNTFLVADPAIDSDNKSESELQQSLWNETWWHIS